MGADVPGGTGRAAGTEVVAVVGRAEGGTAVNGGVAGGELEAVGRDRGAEVLPAGGFGEVVVDDGVVLLVL